MSWRSRIRRAASRMTESVLRPRKSTLSSPMDSRIGNSYWVMVLVTLLWSSAGVVSRHLEAARGFEVTFWRSAFNALALLVALPLLRGAGLWRSLREGGRALWLSGLCWAVMFTAFMFALTLTSVANVLVTMAIGPLITALFARVFPRHFAA